MSKYEFISDIVNGMNEHKIMEYQPHTTIIDFVSNFWLKNFQTETLLAFPINSTEAYCKETYLKQFPFADEDTVENFAVDTVFHIAFRLSKQGRWTDNVIGTQH